MKKLLTISLCLLTVFSLSGCIPESEKPIENNENHVYRFQTIKEYEDGWTMYDKETGKMYFLYDIGTDGHSGAIDLHQQYEGWDK